MEYNTPSLLNINIDFIVENIGKLSHNFSRALALPSNLIELILQKYLIFNPYVTQQEVKYFLSQKAHFSSIDLSSSFHTTNSWLDLLPSTILRLDVSNCLRLTDEGLLKIASTLSNLQQLKINSCFKISEKSWTCVSSLSHLQVFEASGTQFGDEALSLLSKSCHDLRVLILNNTRVFKAISEIKNLIHLVDLDLDYTKITPGALLDLSKSLTQLKRLKANVFNNVAFNSVYSHLPQSLETLELDCLPAVPNNEFEHLTGLQKLALASWNEGNLFSISNFKHLTHLCVDANLSGTDGYDWSKMKFLKAWRSNSDIHATSLINCIKVDYPDLADRESNLTKLTNLSSIRFEANDNMPEILEKNVLMANLQFTNISLNRLTNLKKIRLASENEQELLAIEPMLRNMHITALISPRAMPYLTALTSLQKLLLYDPCHIEIGVLTNLTMLEANCSMDQISKLTNLRCLDLRYAELVDHRLDLLTLLTNLTSLDIGGLSFSEQTFDALTSHLTNLKRLLMMSVDNIDVFIPYLTRLSRLQHLFIDQAPSASSLSILSKLPSLKELHSLFVPEEMLDETIQELIDSPSLCSIHYEINNNAIVQQFANVGINFLR